VIGNNLSITVENEKVLDLPAADLVRPYRDAIPAYMMS
jgi:hypothetical protein